MGALITTFVSWLTVIIRFSAKNLTWIYGLFKDFKLLALALPLMIFEGLTGGITYIIYKIPVPDFLSSGGMQSLFSVLPDTVTYFVWFFGIPEALALFSAGVVFRLTRKALTLGQW